MIDSHLGPTGQRSRVRQLCFGAFGLALTVSALLPGGAWAQGQVKLLTEVHFDPGSAEVTIGGMKKIDSIIGKLQKQGLREVRLIGFTDSTGDENINQKLALKRAKNVAMVLSERGIVLPVVIEGKGEKGTPYKTPDNVSEPLNRCVGILAVGG